MIGGYPLLGYLLLLATLVPVLAAGAVGYVVLARRRDLGRASRLGRLGLGLAVGGPVAGAIVHQFLPHLYFALFAGPGGSMTPYLVMDHAVSLFKSLALAAGLWLLVRAVLAAGAANPPADDGE